MRNAQLRAEDPDTGLTVGWHKSGKIYPLRDRATTYISPGALTVGMESVERRWPQYKWRAFFYRSEQEAPVVRRQKRLYSREEVIKLLTAEREACVMLCEHFGYPTMGAEISRRPPMEKVLG